MVIKAFIILASCLFVESCTNGDKKNSQAQNKNSKVILDDSLKSELSDSIVSLARQIPDGITVSGRFIEQNKLDNATFLSIQLEKDSVLVLNNPMPLSEDEIKLLKKKGNNITLTYSESDQNIKFIATQNDSAH
jgi:hypothetical protein